MNELTTAQADLVDRLTDLNQQISELTQQADEIKAKLRADLADGQHTIDGRHAVTISITRRFDSTTATQVLPAELLTLCQTTTVDAKRAKEVLPPALYEQCQREIGKATVRLA